MTIVSFIFIFTEQYLDAQYAHMKSIYVFPTKIWFYLVKKSIYVYML